MTGERHDASWPDGLAFMLHVFFCGECPEVAKASDRPKANLREIHWLREPTPVEMRGTCSPDPVDVGLEWRRATMAATDHPRRVDYCFFCPEGFALLKAAREKGWGA